MTILERSTKVILLSAIALLFSQQVLAQDITSNNKLSLPDASLIQEYVVSGKEAWSEAVKKGFFSYPDTRNKQQTATTIWGVSSCFASGSNSSRECFTSDNRSMNMAKMQYGSRVTVLKPASGPGEPNEGRPNARADFYFFCGGLQLHPAWTIKRIQFSGGNTFSVGTAGRPKYRANTRDICTGIHVQNLDGRDRKDVVVTLDKIVLVGPKRRSWREAFDAYRTINSSDFNDNSFTIEKR